MWTRFCKSNVTLQFKASMFISNNRNNKGKTINSDYYIDLLDSLKNEIAQKRPNFSQNKVLFH